MCCRLNSSRSRFVYSIIFTFCAVTASHINLFFAINDIPSNFLRVWWIVSLTVQESLLVTVGALILCRKLETHRAQLWTYFITTLVLLFFSIVASLAIPNTNSMVFLLFYHTAKYLRSAQEIEESDAQTDTAQLFNRLWTIFKLFPFLIFWVTQIGRTIISTIALPPPDPWPYFINLNIFTALFMFCSGEMIKDNRESVNLQKQLRNEAEIAMSQHARFTALISHELRTPLNGVLSHYAYYS
jgi:signal transduction histidine kinase